MPIELAAPYAASVYLWFLIINLVRAAYLD